MGWLIFGVVLGAVIVVLWFLARAQGGPPVEWPDDDMPPPPDPPLPPDVDPPTPPIDEPPGDTEPPPDDTGSEGL